MVGKTSMKRRICLAAVSCLWTAGFALAQQAFYGSIVGNVTDASQAAIPNAAVTVTNTDTNVDIAVTSGASGLYQALNLKTGTYRVKITAPGFQTFVRDNIILQAGQQVRIDASLQVGAMTQTIEVKTEAPLINTET